MDRQSPRSVSRVALAAHPVVVDLLEPRKLLAVQASPYDQFVIELINRARADPAAEAARLGINLNEGLTAGTISTAMKQPLAIDNNLNASIRDHLNWLRTNSKFQHEGSGNSTPQSRMAAAGYDFSGSYGSAENLALSLAATTGDLAARTEELYKKLFIDADVGGRGHRLNLLNGAMRSVGSGTVTGDYTYNSSTWQSVLIGQDYAYNSGNPFLVGVAYDDNLKNDDFYSPGEGVSGVTVTATSAANGHVYTTTTGVAGGYQMQLPPGTYSVKAVRSGKVKTVTYTNVVVGASNVKRDFTGDQFDSSSAAPLTYTLKNGVLTIAGTTGADSISLGRDDDGNGDSQYVVTLNGTTERLDVAGVESIVIDGDDGNDAILVDNLITGGAVQIHGGDGNDTIAGSGGNDRIWGGGGRDVVSGNSGNDTIWGEDGEDNLKGNGGKDQLWGGDGNDRLNGGGSADKLNGEAQNDRMYGEDGDDVVDGGGNNDRCYGGDGSDTLLGGNGIDRLYGNDGDDELIGGRDADVLNGGPGRDKARDRASIDSVLDVE